MEIKEFIEKFAEQFDETDPSMLTPETQFRGLEEWSSLIALNTILMVDADYDVTINGDDILKADTIEDLFNIIKSRA